MIAGKHIYFIRPVNMSGPIKIGTSKEPDGRVNAVGLWSPIKLELVASAPGSFSEETYLHRLFAKHRMHGEWFLWSPDLQELIDYVAKTGALPAEKHDVTNASMAEAYCAGQTLQQIGDMHGISRERVRQILRADGIESFGMREQHKRRSVAEINVERAMSLASAGAALKEIAEEIGDSVASVRKALKLRNITLPRPDAIQPSTRAKARLVADDYLAGMTGPQLAVRHKIKPQMTYYFLKIAGVSPIHRTAKDAA